MTLPLILIVSLQTIAALRMPATYGLANQLTGQASGNLVVGPLLVRVQAPDQVASLDELSVKTTLINTGDKRLKILDNLSSLVNSAKAYSFDLHKVHELDAKSNNASSLDVTLGESVSKSDCGPHNTSQLDTGAYTVLEPKQNKTVVVHDISDVYALPEPGLYVVRASLSTRCYAFVSEDGTVNWAEAMVHGEPKTDEAAVFIADKSAIELSRRQVRDSAPYPIFYKCSPNQKHQILAAIEEMFRTLREVNRELSPEFYYQSPRFTRWFGSPTVSPKSPPPKARWLFVRANYAAIGRKPNGYRYECSPIQSRRYTSENRARARADRIPTVVLTPKFWELPLTGNTSKVGVLIRAATIFEAFGGGTKDYEIGEKDASNLARKDPMKAIYNADTYRLFVENPPIQPAPARKQKKPSHPIYTGREVGGNDNEKYEIIPESGI